MDKVVRLTEREHNFYADGRVSITINKKTLDLCIGTRSLPLGLVNGFRIDESKRDTLLYLDYGRGGDSLVIGRISNLNAARRWVDAVNDVYE